jgi:hypothetical protein
LKRFWDFWDVCCAVRHGGKGTKLEFGALSLVGVRGCDARLLSRSSGAKGTEFIGLCRKLVRGWELRWMGFGTSLDAEVVC